MAYDLKLTVKDILQLPDFKNAKVVTNNSDLTRRVEWGHILEIIQIGDLATEKQITEIGDFVNDNVMIFATGVGWNNKEDVLIFLRQLIDRNVAALCLQLGYHYNEIPKEMVELADQHSFPIIVFYKEVRYIDVMYNLHTLFINQDYKLFLEIEKFLEELNHLILAPHDFKDILYFFHNYLNVNVVYIPIEGDEIFVPLLSPVKHKTILNLINELEITFPPKNIVQTADNNQFSYIEINANNNKLAYLAFFSDNPLNRFQLLALEKSNFILAQEILRNLYIEEKEKFAKENQKWILDWLHGLLPEIKINQYIKQLIPKVKVTRSVACIMTFENSNLNNSSMEFMLHITMIARPIFKKQGLYLLNYFKNNHTIYIILDTKEEQNCDARIENAITELKNIIKTRNNRLDTINLTFSIGKIVDNLNLLNKSFKTAKETLDIQQKTGNTNKIFYDNLHVYRIISLMEKNEVMDELIIDYLQPIIEYDHQHNANLLKTLKVFLECNCNKKETANQLYIVRQTLYHRIDKIGELLGKDFMLPQKRMMIELALYTYDYLN